MALLETLHIDGHDYAFQQLRHFTEKVAGVCQEGVIEATDYQVVQRAAGANMSVDVSAGDAFVKMDSGVRNGLYFQTNDAVVNVPVGAAHATLPRIDQVVLQVNDPNVVGAVDTAELKILAGTPTSSAQAGDPTAANYRAGAAALGNDRIRLADITVPAAAASILTANIQGRRPWARGAYWRALDTGGDKTSPSSSFVEISGSAFKVELSGRPVRMSLRAPYVESSSPSAVIFVPRLDGAAIESGMGDQFYTAPTVAASRIVPALAWDFVPAAGLHRISWAWRTGAGTAKLGATAASQLEFVIEEIARQNSQNS